MAFNIGDFENINPKLPKLEAQDISHNFGPPRKIDLTDQEIQKVHEIKEKFERSGIDIESLFEFFTDWQSNKTKSIKRFVLSLSFILSLALVAGVKILEIDLFGMTVSEGWDNYFLSSVLVMHLSLFFYYQYLKSIDFNVQQAKIHTVEEELEEYVKLAHEIDQIVEKNNLESASELFSDFGNPIVIGQGGELSTYDSIKFYDEKLRKQHMKFKWGEVIENIVIYGLGFAGLVSIINSFL
jgi:hypothetical protein